MNAYLSRINAATTLDELDVIVEEAAFDNYITNKEYEQVYETALKLARCWEMK